MLQGARSAIRDGQETKFWTTRWVDSGIHLADFAEEEAEINLEDSVASFVDDTGGWDFSRLHPILPAEAIEMIAGMSPPAASQGEDQWIWGLSKDGKFTIKSAYLLLQNASSGQDMWNSIWQWKGPNRVRLFLWLAIQDKLLTNSQRQRRHLSSDATCSTCQDPNEDVSHVIRDCKFALEVWHLIGNFDLDSMAWNCQLSEWISKSLYSPNGLLFGLICWCLWKSRNGRIFSNSTDTARQVAARIVTWTNIVKHAMERDLMSSNLNRRYAPTQIAWTPGPTNWMVLNTDGSVLQPSSKAAAGGLLRDALGRCRAAFSLNLGSCSITRAEIRGVIFGLQLAWDLGYRRVLAQLDSSAAIAILEADGDVTHQHALEVFQFRELVSRNWDVKLIHIYREANKAADFLAGKGHSLTLGNHLVPSSDNSLGFYLRYDCIGISEERLIVINS
ncbi:Putative ribonuclease H protein At1g65750 [Linum perenne]